MATLTGAADFYQRVIEIQQKVFNTQAEVISQVAERMVQTIQKNQLIYIFGTGHSHMIAEEGHMRAGGLAHVVPMLVSGFMLHENTLGSSALERTPGVARIAYDHYHPAPGSMLFVVSNSGVNVAPVEMALLGKEHGLTTVSISSHEYAKIAPLSVHGKRINEIADFAIDNCGEIGDALVPFGDNGIKAAASSTMVGAMIWNMLVAEVCSRLYASGTTTLPIYVSFNAGGAKEHNIAITESMRGRNPHM